MPETTPPSPTIPLGEEIGEVIGFFAVPSAAIIEVKKDSLKLGDTIWIRGHTTDLKQQIDSMQIEHDKITEAQPGQQVGIKVAARVRRGDKVYKVSS